MSATSPPLAVWVDERGWLATQKQGFDTATSVRMAAKIPGKQTVVAAIAAIAAIAVVALSAGAVAVYATADTSSGESSRVAYAATPLPTTTTITTTTTIATTATIATTTTTTTIATATATTIAPAPTTTVAGTEPAGPLVDPSGFGTERPTTLVGGVLFGFADSNDAAAATVFSGRGPDPLLLGCECMRLAG
ncbi:MAG: hypothetical protein ACKVG5_06805 [Acidimicrobiales bacterium]